VPTATVTAIVVAAGTPCPPGSEVSGVVTIPSAGSGGLLGQVKDAGSSQILILLSAGMVVGGVAMMGAAGWTAPGPKKSR
jgi:hypothetical protein